jgi:hypothetical protein
MEENAQLTDLNNKNIQLANALNSTSFNQNAQNQNLIEFQLETDIYLDKLKHFLSGDVEFLDEKGNRGYIEQTNTDLIVLNKIGVNDFMSILSGLIGKETFLSVYSEERINEVIGDIMQEVRKETFANAKLYGLDTEYKITKFVLLVFRTGVFIENAYRRSIGGKEREGLKESRIVTQSQPLTSSFMGGGIPTGIMPKKKFSLFNKNTW